EHVLAFSAHHIVCDGWSWGVLLDEIGAVFSASCQGIAAELDEPTPFSTYAAELAQEQNSSEGTEAYNYWVEQFADLPEPLNLPTDRPRSKVKSHSGGSLRMKFDSAAYQAIKQAAVAQGSSLYVALLATFQVMMARLAEQEDVVVTIPTAGQATAGMDALVGHCVNFLPLRAQVDNEKPFAEFLAEVQATLLEAYDYQGCTFGGIVARLNLPRRPDRLPLSEITFNLDRDDARLNFYGLEAKVAQARKNAVIFDIFFNVNELNDGLIVDCDYNTDLYDEETMARWIGCYETLMASIAANPNARIGDLTLINAIERQQILTVWNDTAEDYPRDATIDQLFEAQAVRIPDSVAVIYGDVHLTYSELNRRANQLAHYLHQQGVQKGALVGIALERSLETAISILAVLKVGGAYVPLDPAYPAERISFMMADAQISVVITTRQFANKYVVDNVQFVCLDEAAAQVEQCAGNNLQSYNQAVDTAYVIYTSGSTGTPKGVCGLHRGVVNRCTWMWSTYPFASDEVCCHKTSLNFVDSVWEIFGPLLQGVPTVYVAEQDAKSVPDLVRVLARHKVTRLVLVPSLLRAMLEDMPNLAQELPALHLWVTSGEALSLELCHQFYAQMQGRTLLNLYGSSEVAADVTYFDTRELGERNHVPIGQPIQNTQIYIVDRAMQPVPIGVPGEIYVGGDGLSSGYLHRPALTVERFVRNPFGNDMNAMLYKTGDIGRWRASGQIEYLGRVDHQIKVRGFRIELGEIEAQLARHV
ncbi:MAG: amino acid adenylation domain-containing protein, partial [Caldilineaceae bacterium]|nr:amino acid adenylation domain-containing protein [Caldilineaceae bacterium]